MERLFGPVIMMIALIALFGMYAYVIIDDGDRTLLQRIKQRVRKFFSSPS